jgi:hypothetical protein
MARPIYVEITIRAPMDDLWRLTQTPDLHERWDLRFSTIEYLPRKNESVPQQFLYETRIGLGLRIQGTGESMGTRDVNGARSSALRFASGDPKSLILEGSGYWKYIPEDSVIRFLTLYDYRTRFGLVGRLADSLVFRPLIGWATAWSFDRLRLWLERGTDPTLSALRAIADAIARASLAFIWIYQGAVPKLILQHHREHELIEAAVPAAPASLLLIAAGALEVFLGLMYILAWRWRGVYWTGMVALVLVTLPALASSPALFTEPFNPTTLTIAMLALSVMGLIASRDLPSAARCLRRKPAVGAQESPA